MERGQSSIELVILIGFLVIVFLGFLVVINEKMREQIVAQQRDKQVQLADLVEKELLLANKVRPGYMRQFSLPRVIEGQYYQLHLEDGNALVINATDEEYIRFLSINMNIDDGGSLLPDGPLLKGTWDPDVGYDSAYTIIIEKTIYFSSKGGSLLIVRKDCADVSSCPKTTTI